MKKPLLFSILLGASVTVVAQQQIMQRPTLKKYARPVKNVDYSFYDMAVAATSSQRNTPNPSVQANNETIVGLTTYSLQTNRSTMNRCHYNSDGTVSVAYQFSNGAFNSWPDRGTGYNYHDGSNWGANATARIENDRTGFSDLGITGTGGEIIIGHNTNQSNAQHVCIRPVKGTGTWTESTTAIPSPPNFTYGTLWPRIAVGGPAGLTIHHIALTTPTANPPGGVFQGQDGALVYSRSTDGGVTWSVPAVPALLDSSQYVNWAGDAYAIHARGNNVAIVIGDLTSDVVLLKSTDDGVTWTKTVVNAFPFPLYNGAITDTSGDGVGDNIPTNDQSFAVVLDNQGEAHVFYGYMETVNNAGVPDSVLYTPGAFGLMYWNEGMAPDAAVMIAGPIDYNANTTLDVTDQGSYYTSLTSHPSAGVDAAGNIFVSYSAILEGTDDGAGKSYRGIYLVASTDDGATWTNPYIINPTDPVNSFDFYERVYPSIGHNIPANVIPLIYQRDAFTGHGVGTGNPDTDNAGATNEIVYVEVPKTDIVGVKEIATSNVESISLFPNPANDNVSLAVTLKQGGNYTVLVQNVLGQSMMSKQNNLPAGASRIELNTESLSAGVYFVTLDNGKAKVTTKLVIE